MGYNWRLCTHIKSSFRTSHSVELNWRWLSKCVPGVHSAAPSGESETGTEPWIFLQVPCTLSACCGFGDKDVGRTESSDEQENMASSYYIEWGYHSSRAEACAQACQCRSELWAPLHHSLSSSSSWWVRCLLQRLQKSSLLCGLGQVC